MAWLLFQAAHRPTARRLGLLALAAAVDAVLSVRHLATTGLGPDIWSAVLRLAATAGPIVGTGALAWSAHLARCRHPEGVRPPRGVFFWPWFRGI